MAQFEIREDVLILWEADTEYNPVAAWDIQAHAPLPPCNPLPMSSVPPCDEDSIETRPWHERPRVLVDWSTRRVWESFAIPQTQVWDPRYQQEYAIEGLGTDRLSFFSTLDADLDAIELSYTLELRRDGR